MLDQVDKYIGPTSDTSRGMNVLRLEMLIILKSTIFTLWMEIQ